MRRDTIIFHSLELGENLDMTFSGIYIVVGEYGAYILRNSGVLEDSGYL